MGKPPWNQQHLSPRPCCCCCRAPGARAAPLAPTVAVPTTLRREAACSAAGAAQQVSGCRGVGGRAGQGWGEGAGGGGVDSDPGLGSTGQYLAARCTKPCGNATCLPCPRGTFLARENHHQTSCARCETCDEQREGLPSVARGSSEDRPRPQSLQEVPGLGPCGVGGPCTLTPPQEASEPFRPGDPRPRARSSLWAAVLPCFSSFGGRLLVGLSLSVCFRGPVPPLRRGLSP